MANILSEHKLNFTFYCTFVLMGIVGALLFYVLSVTLAIPFLMFCAIGCLASGLITAELLRRGGKEKSEHKQTHYMKNLAKRWGGKPRPKPRTRTVNTDKAKKLMEKIPPVEILPEEEEKKAETIGELEE